MAELIRNYVRHSATAGTRNTERVLCRPSAHSLPECWTHNSRMRCGASAPHTQNAHYCEIWRNTFAPSTPVPFDWTAFSRKFPIALVAKVEILFLESMAVNYLYSPQIMGNKVNNFNRNSYSIACNSCFMGEKYDEFFSSMEARWTHSIFICSE